MKSCCGFLFFMFCFVSITFSQTNDQEERNPNAPENTVKIPGTEIYVNRYDEKSPMQYRVAISSCACKGKGWRLPTIGELQVIYDHKEMFDNFSKDWYWALDHTESYHYGESSPDYAVGYRFFNLNFKNGRINDEEEDETNKVRCIWSPITPE